MFVEELCDVFSSLTASSPGLICGQCVFPGVDGHFQTGPLGFQLPRPQSESALYRTHAWGYSIPHAPQPRFRSSCYYGQSNPVVLHTHTYMYCKMHSFFWILYIGWCQRDRTCIEVKMCLDLCVFMHFVFQPSRTWLEQNSIQTIIALTLVSQCQSYWLSA